MTDAARQLTTIRKGTHGDFSQVARVAQGCGELMRSAPNWDRLSVTRRQALDEMQHKIARILCGNPDHADHWDDIGGYARLGRDDGSPA